METLSQDSKSPTVTPRLRVKDGLDSAPAQQMAETALLARCHWLLRARWMFVAALAGASYAWWKGAGRKEEIKDGAPQSIREDLEWSETVFSAVLLASQSGIAKKRSWATEPPMAAGCRSSRRK